MTFFEELLKGNYPEHLYDELDPDNSLESPGLKEERLNKIQQRIDEIDKMAREKLRDKQLPFERRILGAIAKDLRLDEPRYFFRHNKEVFDLVGTVFENLDKLNEEANGIAVELGEPERNKLCEKLRIAAFLHDTGKAFEQARHPVLGWHVMTDLATVGASDNKTKDALLDQLKQAGYDPPDSEYRRLARLVRDHDKFGVISTGEASYVILGSMMHYGHGSSGTSLEQLRDSGASLEQLRDTWLLNLADIGGTAAARPSENKIDLAKNLKVRDDKFEALTYDWKVAAGIIGASKSFSEAIDELRQISGTPKFTVQRIKRLLIERSKGWGTISNTFSEDLIEDALEARFSPKDLLPFCRDFGMVAKLDYALQFWNELADYIYVKKLINKDVDRMDDTSNQIDNAWHSSTSQIKEHPKFSRWGRIHSEYAMGEKSPWIGLIVDLVSSKSDFEIEGRKIQDFLVEKARAYRLEEGIAKTQVDLLIAILRRVITAYRGLIQGGGPSDNAPIGVGFSYLRGDKEKQLALYELLSSGEDGRERGLRWLIDEIASWELLA